MKKIITMMMVVLMPLWMLSGCGYGGGGGGDGGNQDGNAQDGNGGDNNGGDKITDLPCQSNSDCPTGWACDLGTNKCKPQGCTKNSDCPQGYYCDLTVYQCKPETCVPDCTGKCCGNDGCGNICPNACVPGEICDLGTCQCKPDVTCTSNEDCPQGYYCDHVTGDCVCIPQCEGKCCGPDGCGSTCPNSCPGYCDTMTCQCESPCYSNSDCPEMHCCLDGSCYAANCGTMQCGFDPVCEFSCGTCQAGYTCEYNTGMCVPDGPGDLCPTGQDCIILTESGMKGCLVPPSSIPAGNPECLPDSQCQGNFYCICMDPPECTEYICIEHCGTCPTGLVCLDPFSGGPWLCLTPEYGIPPNAPPCNPTDYSCQGNASCFEETGTGNLICIEHCSAE